MRFASRSNGTWTRKKGVRGKATRPPGRLHRPGPRRSSGRTRDDPRLRQGHRGSRRNPRTRKADCANRQEQFEKLIDQFERTEDPIRQDMATVMISFVAGLFVGEGKFQEIRTISIWSVGFACPRVTSGGFTVTVTRVFGSFRGADVGACAGRARRAPRAVHRGRLAAVSGGPRAAVPETGNNRRKIMRKARSKKKRPILLADLEERYRESPEFCSVADR